jgi:hypothetical protein
MLYVLTDTLYVLTDTLYVLTDTLYVLTDTLYVLTDTLYVLTDTLYVLTDTLEPTSMKSEALTVATVNPIVLRIVTVCSSFQCFGITFSTRFIAEKT